MLQYTAAPLNYVVAILEHTKYYTFECWLLIHLDSIQKCAEIEKRWCRDVVKELASITAWVVKKRF